MYTIQYVSISGAHLMQTFDSKNRSHLIKHLARFKRPIMAVYERASPITKAVRVDLAKLPHSMISKCARDFVNSRP
jgi:hypothetical protein